ncbi:MAG: hypothetical protein RMI34_11890 [Chloroherpetonaceae bacterium]|nr:hypothetical protein [Chloroherpetonaceae bacterium]MCS7210045.1 hypothetical protein [Chloroherpetonaceae bacterium]MDW8020757.1 hypothetical protein [Chloroherpetonaceae bacterium]MDW8467139.1 hypothetical protein [Chloroherpetonaceae bacterium]
MYICSAFGIPIIYGHGVEAAKPKCLAGFWVLAVSLSIETCIALA